MLQKPAWTIIGKKIKEAHMETTAATNSTNVYCNGI